MRRLAITLVVAYLSLLAVASIGGQSRMSSWPIRQARRRGRWSSVSELRCVVCQNQSIDDSNAELARDLRVVLRERIAAGRHGQRKRSSTSWRATAVSCSCGRRCGSDTAAALVWPTGWRSFWAGCGRLAVYLREPLVDLRGPRA